MKKIAIISTHPIQYNTPLFQLLAKQVDLKVFYSWGEEGAKAKYDPDFKKTISWDIPLLEGYAYEFLNNTAKDPGSHHFNGIINTDIIEHISKFKPDVIIVYGWAYRSHLKALRYFKGKVPIWFRGDSHMLNKQSVLKGFLRKLLLTWIYKHVDLALYVGTANKAYFLHHGLIKSQLLFVPHAIDNNRFSENRTIEAQNLRTKLGVKENEILILFAGKFEPKKNPLLLLNCFLKMNLPDVHLLFLGNGVLEEQLKSLAVDNKNIHFINFTNQKDMPLMYQASQIFCLPSDGPETWGLAVNEAMAAGNAILVSDKVGCATDLVKSGENGYIFSATNEEDIILHLNKLLDWDILNKFGQQSKQIIRDWSLEKQAEIIIKKLHEIN